MGNWTMASKSRDQGMHMDFKCIWEEEVSIFADSWMYSTMQRKASGVIPNPLAWTAGWMVPLVKR